MTTSGPRLPGCTRTGGCFCAIAETSLLGDAIFRPFPPEVSIYLDLLILDDLLRKGPPTPNFWSEPLAVVDYFDTMELILGSMMFPDLMLSYDRPAATKDAQPSDFPSMFGFGPSAPPDDIRGANDAGGSRKQDDLVAA